MGSHGVFQDKFVAVEWFGSFYQTLRPGLNWAGCDSAEIFSPGFVGNESILWVDLRLQGASRGGTWAVASSRDVLLWVKTTLVNIPY